ncbi:NAD(P)-binding protein [Dentipellis sp. KUC8613]|nr:NAD(P)-binding protein [Dentipellis sp. KUC8613]
MSSALPPTQRALVIQTDKTIALQSIPLDNPGPGQVLVKNITVAQNPADWKGIEYGQLSAGRGLGWDFAGRIAALGEGVTNWKIGDRVAGCVLPLKAEKISQNAYCEYTLTTAQPLLRIPDNITDEEAASIPLAAFTALHGLHIISDIPKRAPLGGRALLVWGGSSSVGQFAIQIAHIAGYKVIATASPKNHALLKSLGAAVTVDYHAADAVEQIVAASGRGGVDFVYDAITEGGSTELAAKTLRRDGPRRLAVVLPLDVAALDQSVDYYFSAPIALFGHDIEFAGMYLPRNKAEFELGVDFFENAARWLAEGRLKPNPIIVRPGGLSGVQAGLEFMKAGKVSGAKLVYRVAETPA